MWDPLEEGNLWFSSVLQHTLTDDNAFQSSSCRGSLLSQVFCKEIIKGEWKVNSTVISKKTSRISRCASITELADIPSRTLKFPSVQKVCAKKFLKVRTKERKKSIIFTSTYIGKSSTGSAFYTGKAQRTLSRATVCVKWKWKLAWNVNPSSRSVEKFQEKGKNYRETGKRKKEINLWAKVDCTMESTFTVWTSVPCGMCRS